MLILLCSFRGFAIIEIAQSKAEKMIKFVFVPSHTSHPAITTDKIEIKEAVQNISFLMVAYYLPNPTLLNPAQSPLVAI